MLTERSEDIQQMSIGIDDHDEPVIMIMQGSLQRIRLQHKRFGPSPHHVEKGAPIVVTKIGCLYGSLQLEKDETCVKHRLRILNEPAEWPAAQMSVAGSLTKLGYLPSDQTGSQLMFLLISQLYERTPDLDDHGDFGEQPTVFIHALLDHLTQHCYIIETWKASPD